MTRLTNAELAAMEARANRATPGTWRYDHIGQTIHSDGPRHGGSGDMLIADIRGWGYLNGAGGAIVPEAEAAAIQDANGYFLPLAREDMPRLLAELKAERERCAELLRLLEMTWRHFDDRGAYCRVCRGGAPSKNDLVAHKPSCAIAKALKETE